MEENKILLLSQLINILNQGVLAFESAYENQDKEKFDSSKDIILEAQKKIDYLLKDVN